MPRLLLLLFLACSGLWVVPVAGAAPAGVVTILEGKARLLRAAAVYPLQEGMALAPADVLESDERTHIQLEFSDGSVLGIGPRSDLYLSALPAGADHPGELLSNSGWLKVSGPATAGLIRCRSPDIVLHPKSGAYVFHRQAPVTEFFVEAGELVPAGAGKSGARLAPVKAGSFVEVKPGPELNVSGRPSAAFLAALPRAFVDTLPARMAKFTGRVVEPVLDHALTFAEADRLFKAYPSERKQLLTRLAPRLKDRDFRAQVEKNVPAYPEWDRVLHPEKYLPKETKP